VARPWSRGATSVTASASRQRAVVGAARKINLGRRSEVDKLRLRQTTPWQALAWRHYDAIGEVKYAFNYFANVLSRVRLYAAYSPDDRDGPPTPIGSVGGIDRDIVTAARWEVAKLDNAHGGQAGLMRAFGLNLAVAGDGYLVDHGGQLGVYSTNEVKVQGTASETSSGVQIVPRRFSRMDDWIDLPADAFIARVWRPHPSYSDEADSSLLGVREACEELLMLSRMIRASAMSQINAGILYVAEELSFERATDVRAEPPVDDPNNPDQGEDDDAFEEEFTISITEPIEDELSPSAVVPMLVRGPADMAETAIKKIDLTRPFDEQAVKLRETALERVLNGLDIPKDLVTGLANVRFSNAQQINENMYKAHIEPVAMLIAEAMTVTRLRPALMARGIPPEKVARCSIWYDASEVVTNSNRSEDADSGHDRLLISDKTWRRDHGYSEDDAPDDEELARRIAEKTPVAAETAIQLLAAFMPVIADLAKEGKIVLNPNSMNPAKPPVHDTAVANPNGGGGATPGPAAIEAGPSQVVPNTANGNAPPPPEGTPAPAGLVAAGQPVPVGNLDLKRVLEIERRLRASLQTMLTDMTERALEKAGSRLASKVRGKPEVAVKIKDVPKAQVAAVLGKEALVAAGFTDHQIINDSIDQTEVKYKQQVKAAQLQAMRILGEGAFNESDVDASWSVLKPMLVAFVLRALFRKQEAGYTLKVPMDDVRAALARAGGAQPIKPSTGGRPQPGAVLSDRSIAMLADTHDAEIGGYRWVYGISDNHFQPHLDLDGAEFDGWTSPVLRNPNPAFPRVEYLYPGDHGGCECDWLPTLLPRQPHEGEHGGKTMTRDQAKAAHESAVA
jgi:hypothetical protein